MLCICNATVYTPRRMFAPQHILVENGRVVDIRPAQSNLPFAVDETFDAKGLILSPGWIDIQINGAFGHDFTEDPTCIWDVAAQLPRLGVTAFLPTIVTSPPETVEKAIRVLQQGPPPGWKGAIPLGLHIESMFLNPEKRGAHNPAYLRPPTPELIAGWTRERHVRLCTLAPELPGALTAIRTLRSNGVTVSIGHTMATLAEAEAGFVAGITYGTHLYNAMRSPHHREPGAVGALLAHEEITVGLIVDGIHVHPAMVVVAWQCKSPHTITLVTDAMAALGMPPGHYRLGDLDVTVDETSARLQDGRLAGSVLRLNQAVRNLMRYTGCSLEDALTTVTRTPARVIDEPRGYVQVGARADFTFITPDVDVVATMVGGEFLYKR